MNRTDRINRGFKYIGTKAERRARERDLRSARKQDGETKELRRKVLEIDEKGNGLSDWEIKFIGDMIDREPLRYTEAQAKQINRIYGKAIK